ELDHDGESNGYAESANGFAVAATVTAVLAAALSLAGCAVGPHYVPPDTPPAEFDGGAGGLLVEKPFEAAWWAQFGDPLLDELIERALVGDLDIRIAAARIDESRALLHSSRRAQWPSS